jgi:hypothetical protein
MSLPDLYRGSATLQVEHVETLPAPKRPRGGTLGAGSRKPRRWRTVMQQAAYDWDVDGMQLKALDASRLLYQDPASRADVCATSDGRHPCGLRLRRPRRLGCTESSCQCPADTSSMARFLFADAGRVSREAWLRMQSSLSASSRTPLIHLPTHH